MDIENIALSRLAEALSKGENIKKLLSLNVSPYVNQATLNQLLVELKDIEKTQVIFLEWIEILKGARDLKSNLNINSIEELKTVIKTYCLLTGFKGKIEEYSLFFKEIFGVDIFVFSFDYDLSFIIEDSRLLNVSYQTIKDHTPVLISTKNSFFISPYSLFVLDFSSIEGSKLDFDENQNNSFYFPI